eukprot:tig00020723_g13450.t1
MGSRGRRLEGLTPRRALEPLFSCGPGQSCFEGGSEGSAGGRFVARPEQCWLTQGGSCLGYATCAECTFRAGCGWCDDVQGCVRSVLPAFGSGGGSPASSLIGQGSSAAPLTGAAPMPCTKWSYWGGQCGDANACVEVEPVSGRFSVPCNRTALVKGDCPRVACPSRSSCAECAASRGCAWCWGNAQCHEVKAGYPLEQFCQGPLISSPGYGGRPPAECGRLAQEEARLAALAAPRASGGPGRPGGPLAAALALLLAAGAASLASLEFAA